MQTVLLPHGKAQMSDIKSGLLTSDGNDVTIVDGFAHDFCVANLRLGDIAELHARDALLHPTDFRHIFRMCLQCLIALGMLTHIVDANSLNRHKWRIGLLYLAHDARLGV